MNESKPRCLRCLLSEIDPDKYYSTVIEYINSIDTEHKVNEEIYKSRLEICRLCDMLSDGMCILCGCFVEVRAIKKIGNCPHIPHKW